MPFRTIRFMIRSTAIVSVVSAMQLPLLAQVPLATVAGPTPPVATRVPFTVKSPQGERIDDYYWLRDDDSTTKRPEILAYLTAENAYTETMTAPLAPLQATLLAEMRSRIKEDDVSPPSYNNGYWYSTRFDAGAEYPVLLRQGGAPTAVAADAPLEVLLDGPAMGGGKPFFSLGAIEVSHNNEMLAWTDDTTGRRISTLRFKNLTTGETLADVIPGVMESIAWALDNKTVFYIQQDPQLLQTGPVYRHTIGTPVSSDVRVYNESDPTLITGLAVTASHQFVMITLEGFDTSEVRVVAGSDPTAVPTVAIARAEGVRSYADHLNGLWIIRTNDHAHNFKLVEADEARVHDRSTWRELIADRPETSLDGFQLFAGAIAVGERERANAVVRVVPWGKSATGLKPFTILADESAYAMTVTSGQDPDSPAVRVSYTSMITPSTIYDVDLATGARVLRKVQPVIGYDKSLYETTRVWAPARDGKKIPVSLAWRKDRYARTATAPIYQEGYGAYGLSSDADFSSNRVSLLDRGFLLATAHVRGGADLGQDWYEDGRLMHKRNSFNDFEDVTDFLTREKYGASNKVFATGGSAGGLLMGALANQAGNKYLAIGLHVPFVDLLTTMLDETIPLTANEWTQWGDPREKAAYEYMGGYSPIDRIEKKRYPAMLVTTGLWDSQVQYFEPAKYVARLRAMKTDQNPLLLRINMDAGHGGNSGRFNRLKEIALEFAFFIDLAKPSAGT